MKSDLWEGGWRTAFRRRRTRLPEPASPKIAPRIGLALGGGFARGIAHVGVLKILAEHHIPVHAIAGVSAGAIVAAAFASGATPDEIGRIGCAMRFTDVARWSLCRMGFVGSERMERFLQRLLKQFRFENMAIPLGILATDLGTGDSVVFHKQGDVNIPVRASCSYPGLFQPVRYGDQLLVDGAISMEVPAALTRGLGATHVISVHLPMQGAAAPPQNMFQVVNRCFQIMQTRTEKDWRTASDLVISPEARGIQWDDFSSAMKLVEAGAKAAEASLPQIRAWLDGTPVAIAAPQNGNGTGRILYHQNDCTLQKS